MTVTKGSPGRNMGATNRNLRDEIDTDIISRCFVADLCRTQDSILMSGQFHLDARAVGAQYKVEIQYRTAKKQTVAVVMLSEGASDEDLRSGLRKSLKEGYVYTVA